MNLVKRIAEHTGSREQRFYKKTLFQGRGMLLGINCLEPGQVQQPHEHPDQDKFYFIVEGEGQFWLDERRVVAGPGEVIWAPAGLKHGVENLGAGRLSLLIGIAPAP